jgi:hypothetical protein
MTTQRPKAKIRRPSTGGSAEPPSTKTPARKGVVSRVRKGDLDRVTAYLPVELGAQLRMTCARQRIELSEAIAHALREWLAKHG